MNPFLKDLKSSILNQTLKLGEARSDPVPYDTAWVARVRKLNHHDSPAYPTALKWLRENQNPDGSWGSIFPFSAHSSTLNTLSAIIALAQWNNKEDAQRIQDGLMALRILALKMQKETFDHVAFEVILPVLRTEAAKYNLEIPNDVYVAYDAIGKLKMSLILKSIANKPKLTAATWQHSLEMFGDNLPLASYGVTLHKFTAEILSQDGSVFASPSASAYLLIQLRKNGGDSEKILEYLQKLVERYNGGVPVITGFHNFELIFGLELCLKSGLSGTDPCLTPAIEQLWNVWNRSPDGICFSNDFYMPDSDDTAVAIRILHLASKPVNLQSLLNFYNGNYFETFRGERTASLSANLNILYTLTFFNNNSNIGNIVSNLLNWIRSPKCLRAVSDPKYIEVFHSDKWSCSPFYATSRAVFALKDLDKELYIRCIHYLIHSQNEDGGWGKDGVTTQEETAYVVAGLVFARKNGQKISYSSMKQGINYLIANDKNDIAEPIWIDKVLYSVPNLKKAAIICAQYAFENIENRKRKIRKVIGIVTISAKRTKLLSYTS